VQSFQRKFIILCSETVSRNLPVPKNLPKSSLNLPDRHKKSNWPNKPKNKLYLGFSKIKKSQRTWKKAKNYKFGLKKAKLATLQQDRH